MGSPAGGSGQLVGASWQRAAGSGQKTEGLKRLTGRTQLAAGRSLVGRIDVVVISPVGIGQNSEEIFVEVFQVTYCRCGAFLFCRLRCLFH